MNNDSLSGYKDYKNTMGLTLESLLEILQKVEVSFGEPTMGMMHKTPAIVYPIAKGRMDIYVYIWRKKIVVSRSFKQKQNVGKEVAKELAMELVLDANEANDTQLADTYVEELDGIMKQILAGKTEIESMVENAKDGNFIDFYMKQKFTLIKEKFSIFDENQNVCYYVQGNITGLAFHIQDSLENELYHIKKKLIALTPEYTLMQGGSAIGHIKKKIKITKDEIRGDINGDELLIKGNLSGHAFTIELNNKIIGSVNAARLALLDCYNIKVFDPSKKDLVIAIAVICDNSIKNQDD